MVFDVSGCEAIFTAALAAGSVLGGGLLAARWAIGAWRLLSGEGGVRDPIGNASNPVTDEDRYWIKYMAENPDDWDNADYMEYSRRRF